MAEEVYVARLGAFIARALASTGSFSADLDTEALGFQMPEAIRNDPAVTAAGRALGEGAGLLRAGADALDAAIASGNRVELVKALAQLFEGVYRFVDGADALVGHINAKAAALAPPNRTAVQGFAALIPRRAIDFFVVKALERHRPTVKFLLELLGLIERRQFDASGALNEPPYVRIELKLDRIGTLVRDPAAHFANVYGWGTTAFDPIDILQEALAFYPTQSSVKVGKVAGDAFLQTGPFRWSRDSSVAPPGMLLDVSKTFTKTFDTRVEISPTWGLQFKTDLSFGGGIIFRLKPPFDFSAGPKTGTASGSVSFIVNRNDSARGVTIIAGNDLLQLTADNVGVGAELTVGASTAGAVAIDPGVIGELQKLTITIGSKDSDSFLASLLAKANITGTFDLGLGWKPKEGLVVKAAGGLEIGIPMHQSLGPATFETLHLILKINPDGSLALETSASIKGRVGPLTAVVERMGAAVTLAFSNAADKALGPVDLSLGFKPPNGVGLLVDAGVVRGGGYLYLDFDKGEYAGALELVFSEFLALKAIGIITTRMPDGSPGFSLVILITAEFGPPLQLGFGFTLVGVGGLLGLHRTMMLEELAEGVRTGAVDSVMFPDDVIANAPRIISDLRRFFPPEQGTFLVGPLAKLGWGTPTLVSVSLCVIVETPPGNIAILGVLKCILPDEDAALLVLQVKFIGALEMDKSRLWFFASLFGSRVVYLTITGEMGVLVAWGTEKEGLLSVGGFHPKFSPPPLPFPTPARVSFSIINEPFARIRVEGYFAVTSNTAQFGAAVELFYGAGDFGLKGHLGLDALFQFSPFYFIVLFSASMKVDVFGVGLFSVRIRGQLEGTSPWHIEGEGSISLFFFDIDVPFSHTWGESADTVLPDIAALPIIKAELEKRENWMALPPAGARLSVSLRKTEAAAALVLHPLGVLRISQRAVPLDLSIQRIGNQKVSDIDRAAITVTAPGLVQKAQALEQFATAQFQDLDAAAKLSAPGYEPQVGGVDVSASGSETQTTHAVKRVVLHELITIDNNYKEHQQGFFNVGIDWFRRLLGSNATARSTLSQATKAAKVPFAARVKTDAPGFVIADMTDNSAWGGAPTYASHAKAQDALAGHIKSTPAMAGKYHVIPSAEAKAA